MRKKQFAFIKKALTLGCITAGLVSQSAHAGDPHDPQQYTLTSANVDGSNTWTHNVINGSATGTITFNDWGYTGPMGASVNTFEVDGGFNASKLGQIQSVQTVAPDWLTSDPLQDTKKKGFGFSPTLPSANMDGQVQFAKSTYTTPESTFSNMQIDTAGNYFVAKDDMNFGWYDDFQYNNMVDPIETIDTDINFQPYAISDGKGWCGSTMITNPNGVETMAGQITFDFAFDAYLSDGSTIGNAATQLVPGFVMRSYGDYYVNVNQTPTNLDMNFEGHAVGNNMDPTSIVPGVGGTLSAAYQNDVSFLGAGVVPTQVLTSADSYNPDGSQKLNPDGTWAVTIVDVGTPDAVVYNNTFAGYAFLLRADAKRTLEWINPEGHSDYVTTDPLAYSSISSVPVPAAFWLFASGLLGLVSVARRSKH